jgi:uncharacterized short protein YbdD (DUF466 family)
MAITDISISEELMTGAPSIKYRGNEGPKSPEQERMMMADEVLDEAYEQYIFDLLENRPDATPMSKDEFRRMVIMEGMIGKGPVLPEDLSLQDQFYLTDRWQRLVVLWVWMVENNMVLDRSFKNILWILLKKIH